jgi:hypothetical protein
VVLGLAVAAKARPTPTSTLAVAGLVLVFVVAFEIGRGGVEEQHVDLEVEQVRHGEEHRLLHPALGIGLHQQVHRPVRLVVIHARQARDDDILGCPLRRRQLAHRCDRPVTDQRQQHPLHRRGEPAAIGDPLDRGADLQPGPQRVQQPGGADRPGIGDLHRRRTGRKPRLGAIAQPAAVAEVPADRGGQSQQAVHVQAVDPAQVHQHVRFDLAVHPAVVGQRDVAHHRAIGVGSLTESQVHDHSQPQHNELTAIIRS